MLALLMIGWADITDATAAERAKRAMAKGSGTEFQVRVRVTVRVYGWICVKTCKKSMYETFIFYAEELYVFTKYCSNI